MTDAHTTSSPSVSVVVPNYNYAKHLRERIESILHQTETDLELIFLDDASTDDSVAVFESIVSGRAINYRIVLNDTNSGSVYRQWNKGVEAARGDYVWIAEADDYCEPGFLKELLPLMEADPKLGLSYTQSTIVDAGGNVLGDYLSYTSDLDPTRWRHDYHNDGRDEVARYLFFKNTIPNVSAVLFRKEAYVRAGMAPVDMKVAGDWVIYVNILKNYDIAFSSKFLNYHRRHQTSVILSSETNLSYFKEVLYTQRYVRREFKISPQNKKAMFEHFAAEWFRLHNRPNGLSKRNNVRLFFIALTYYPRYLLRLTSLLYRTLIRRKHLP